METVRWTEVTLAKLVGIEICKNLNMIVLLHITEDLIILTLKTNEDFLQPSV
jgi:hypothetical protein